MPRGIIWRVRVRRSIEDWVDVLAETPEQAEADAAKLAGVVSVFGKSAIRGDKVVIPGRPAGVEDE